MTKNDYGSVGCDSGVARKPRLLSRLLKAKAVVFAVAFVLTAFAGTATAAHDLGPPWEFTFTGILIDRCGVRSAMAVGVTDTGGSPIHIQVEDVTGNSLAVDPPRAAYASPSDLNPNLPPGCPIDQSGLYTVTTLKLDCTSRFPSLDVVVKQGLFLSVEFHSQSGACNWVPPLDWDALVDPIGFKVAHPETVYITDVFSLGAFAFNNLPVPILLSVEIVPHNKDICSIVSYGTSSSGMSVRSHGYVLRANGTLGLVFNGNEFALGDSITLSASVKALAVGNCRFSVLATIKTATILEPITLDSREVAVNVTTPPPYADLGGMIVHGGGCGGSFITQVPPPLRQPIEVAAGEVGVDASLEEIQGCHDFNDHAALLIEKKDPTSNEWVPVSNGAVDLSESSKEIAHGKVNLEEGFHEFRLVAHYSEGWISGHCFVLILQTIAGLGAIAAAIVASIVSKNPIPMLIVAIFLILLAPGYIAQFNACKQSFGAQTEEPTDPILVKAIPTSLPADLQRSLQDEADSLGDVIDGLDYDAH